MDATTRRGQRTTSLVASHKPLFPCRRIAPVACSAMMALAGLTSLAAEPSSQQSPAAVVGGFGPDVDLRHSRAYIHVGKRGVLGHEHAVEGQFKSGTIELGATEHVGQLVFDMATFKADTDTARRAIRLEGDADAETARQVDANMQGPDILDVKQFPTATYAIDSARLHTPARDSKPAIYELQGVFTLHGVSRPLKLLATAQETRGWLRVWCQFSILQSEYGIEPYTAALGAVGVADRLQIWGDVWLRPRATTARK